MSRPPIRRTLTGIAPTPAKKDMSIRDFCGTSDCTVATGRLEVQFWVAKTFWPGRWVGDRKVTDLQNRPALEQLAGWDSHLCNEGVTNVLRHRHQNIQSCGK